MSIKEKYRAMIEEAIAFARFSHSRATVAAEDGSEVYAIRTETAWRGA